MKSSKRFPRWAVVAAIVAALVLPGVAFAVPAVTMTGVPPRPGAGAAAQLAARRHALLVERIELVLQARKIRFDSAVIRLTTRIDKVAALATLVEKAGGDVSGVRSSLDKARDLVSQAQAAEAQAVAAFRAVPDAPDRRAAFLAARAQARVAVQTLQTARLTFRNAILDLRAIANGLKGAQQ